MRATINGIRYDSGTSTLIGTATSGPVLVGDPGEPYTDFEWWEAALYRTPRSRRYFLAGRGGPMTRWATSTAESGWAGGSGVKPLDEADALAWARRHLQREEVEAAFGASVEKA